MSRLEGLIAELCPNGVECIPLRECCILSRGNYITKKSAKLGEIPVILGGQEPAYYIDKANHYGKAIVISRSGVSAGFVSYWEEPIFVTDGFIIEAKQELNIRFLYYYLKNMQSFLNSMKKGGGVPHITGENLLEIRIPVPPLPVQREIVQILDNFTELTTELTTKLASELTARKKQYEYYRSVMLHSSKTAREKTLGEICDFVRGPFGGSLKKEIFTKEGYAVYEQQHAIYGDFQFRYFIDKTKYDEMRRFATKPGDLIMSCSGTMGKIAIIPDDAPEGIINQALLKLTPKNGVSNKYLRYCFEDTIAAQMNSEARGGAIKNVASVAVLKDIKIQIPSVEEQNRIVTILDYFFDLCNDLSNGLPAEIEARQKQYEYYRDKLLTFKELTT